MAMLLFNKIRLSNILFVFTGLILLKRLPAPSLRKRRIDGRSAV